jgi:hypothetical protein
MSEETRQTESPKIKKIRERLEGWLGNDDWTFDGLRRWLKGYELPAVGYDKEPYSWLLYGFPEPEYYRREMASRIARFLQDERPHQKSSSDYDDRLFYNLFHLSAGLGCRRELSVPLYDLYDYFARNDDSRRVFFSNEKQYNLNNAFREALITNQIDATFRDIWVGGLEGQQVSFLLGDAYSHFRGILYLSEGGQPCVDDIGWGLKRMAEYVEPEKQRHEKFRHLLERVKEVWSPEKFALNWDELLLLQAKKYEWQDWAAVRLEKFVVPTERPVDGLNHVHIWAGYLPFLNELNIPSLVVSVENIFSEILIPQETSALLHDKFSECEATRYYAPFRNYEGVAQATQEVLYMSLLDDENADERALKEIRIDTFTLVTEKPEEREGKQQEAKRALAATADAGR